MGKFVTIEFEYDDKPVVARVYKGTTLSGGDDRDEVVSINVGGIPYPDKGLRLRLEELALERAQND